MTFALQFSLKFYSDNAIAIYSTRKWIAYISYMYWDIIYDTYELGWLTFWHDSNLFKKKTPSNENFFKSLCTFKFLWEIKH